MIVALILFILVFIFFAFFIGKNLSNVCNFWLFKTFEQLPVSVLVLVAFAMGIAFAVLIFAIFKIKQSTAVDAETAAALKAAKEEKSVAREAKKKERLEKKEKSIRNNKKDRDVIAVPPTDGNNPVDKK